MDKRNLKHIELFAGCGGLSLDIGVHQDGLVHLSQITHRYIKDPNEVLKVNQKVEVTVTEIDANRKRISLSMKANEPREQAKPREQPKYQPRPATANKPKDEPETDMAIKLAMLKGKFK